MYVPIQIAIEWLGVKFASAITIQVVISLPTMLIQINTIQIHKCSFAHYACVCHRNTGPSLPPFN